MSVFRASNSRSTWPGTFPDGPTERLSESGADRRPEPPRAGTAFAVLVAMLALVVATAALLLAWRALELAGQPGTGPVPAESAVSGPGGGVSGGPA